MIKYELQPCPFCGERELLSFVRESIEREDGWWSTNVAIVCSNCGCKGPSVECTKKTITKSYDRAKYKWNLTHRVSEKVDRRKFL
jgi:predicted RNA-binding Zn-ribbon protein involved in translation (DUF1610 family)